MELFFFMILGGGCQAFLLFTLRQRPVDWAVTLIFAQMRCWSDRLQGIFHVLFVIL